MKQRSKQILGILAASALVLGVGNSVYARGGWYGPGGCGGGPGMWQGMGPGMGPGMTGGPRGRMGGPRGRMGGPGAAMGATDPATTAQRLTQLKSDLAIRPNQEKAWGDFATAMTTRAAMMSGHRQARFSGNLTPEEMQQFRQSGMTQRQQMMSARQELYSVLTPDQRAKAGQILWGRGGRGGRW